jgi:hypothetical protein
MASPTLLSSLIDTIGAAGDQRLRARRGALADLSKQQKHYPDNAIVCMRA